MGFDSYNYLSNDQLEMDVYNRNRFVNTVKLRWIMREYVFRYSNDLSILFESTNPCGNEDEEDEMTCCAVPIDHLNERMEVTSHRAPVFDVLFGLRNLDLIKAH